MKTLMKIIKRIIILLTSTFLSLLFLAVAGHFIYTFNMRNPFPEVQWIEDYPGATDRYTEYTPVMKADNRIKLGPSVGADFASLRFKDINNDGIKEAIIETEILINWGEYRFPQRHILQYQKGSTGIPQFILIKSEDFPDQVPDIYRNAGKHDATEN